MGCPSLRPSTGHVLSINSFATPEERDTSLWNKTVLWPIYFSSKALFEVLGVSPIFLKACFKCLPFSPSAAVYAAFGLTTALHCMQKGAVALSIASGSTWSMLMVLRLPQASLPVSSF